jgi:hypothetical protein
MKYNIKHMTLEEIADYLRYERESLIFNFFDRKGVKNNFEEPMSKKEWKQFTKFCLRYDVDGIYDLTETLLDMWKDEKKRLRDDRDKFEIHPN